MSAGSRRSHRGPGNPAWWAPGEHASAVSSSDHAVQCRAGRRVANRDAMSRPRAAERGQSRRPLPVRAGTRGDKVALAACSALVTEASMLSSSVATRMTGTRPPPPPVIEHETPAAAAADVNGGHEGQRDRLLGSYALRARAGHGQTRQHVRVGMQAITGRPRSAQCQEDGPSGDVAAGGPRWPAARSARLVAIGQPVAQRCPSSYCPSPAQEGQPGLLQMSSAACTEPRSG